MDSSTPVAQISSRKLLRNSSDINSPLEKNNDEIERNKRRSDVANLRRLSHVSNAVTGDSPIINHAQHLNKEQILATLNKWYKMHAENKITKHNVWDLHVIDYMRRYLSMQSEAGSVDVLKFASSALEVSAKVYGLRVDSLYDRVMKLWSRINRMCVEYGVADSDSEDANIDDAEDRQPGTPTTKAKNKRKTKRKFAKATIARDDSELFGSFPQIETGMFNTQTYFENSMVENLFSSRLPLSKSGTTMKLLDEECAWRRVSDIDPLVSEPRVHKTYPIQLPPKLLPPLCPELQNFKIDEWDPDELDISHEELEEVVYDKDGFPIPDLDETINNANVDFENGGAAYNDSDDEGLDGEVLTDQMARNKKVAYVVDFNPDNTNMLFANEYSYIGNTSNANQQLSQIWAGPSHWKLKSLKRPAARFTGKQDDKLKNKRARRPKREEEIITFLKEMSAELLNKKCKIPKAPPFASKEKLFVPLPKLDMITLDSMMNKFTSVISKFKRDDEEERKKNTREKNINSNFDDDVDDGLEHYDHNNLNNANYCSPNAVAEEEDCVGQNSRDFLGKNLVDKPDMVQRLHLTYQTRPKRIDMGKLKRAMWDCLTNTNKNKDVQDKMTTTVRFKELLKVLPSKFSTQDGSAISCQTVFVALLHLANEHCLLLENSDNIIIRQAEM